MKSRAWIVMALLVVGTLGSVGCQKTLFSNGDPYNESRLRRYWDGDSAKSARESRQRSQEMGFGFSTGGQN